MSGTVPQSWRGWATFGRDDLLYLDGWRHGVNVHQIRALFFDIQQVRTLRRENLNLSAALEAATAAQDEAEQRAAWYRRQCSAESLVAPSLLRRYRL